MNVYLPSESVSRQKPRFWDWRFVAALVVLTLLAFLVYAGVRNYNARDAEAAQKQALIVELSERAQQIEELQGEINALQNRASDNRKKASKERRQLLRLQERMLKLLRAEGIEAPAPLTPRNRAIPVRNNSDGGARGATVRPASTPKPAPKPQRNRPRQPRPTPAPAPAPQPEPQPSPEPDGLLHQLDDLPIL